MVITFLEGGQLDDLGVDLGPSNFALAANDGRWSTPCFCTVVRRGPNFEISTLLSVLRNSVLSWRTTNFMAYFPLVAQCLPLADLHQSFLTKEFPTTHSAIFLIKTPSTFCCCSTAKFVFCQHCSFLAKIQNRTNKKLGWKSYYCPSF